MELNSWDLCGVEAVKVDSTGCFDCNFSTPVLKGVEIVSHGIGFAPVKLHGEFSRKPLMFGD